MALQHWQQGRRRPLKARSVGRRELFDQSELYVGFAEIAGVFVGFGALIGATRGVRDDGVELARVRGVAMVGLVVVVAALVPVGLAQYGLTEGVLWRVSSTVFLLLIWFAIVVPFRNRAHRTAYLQEARSTPFATAFFWLALELPIQVPLVLAVLGSYPALSPAFYTTAVVLNLFEAALLLAQLVFRAPSSPD